ncbi:MAG: DUF4055 domain-containing protein [Desulfobacteraceae bacterium]|nr:DUF4055 domain-containing protein [Desulfobacteraceae bacterium]
MPVDSEHPQYIRRKKQWKRCRDAVEGSDDIKEAGVKYLPMLEGMDDQEYAAYKKRAMFYGASGRTVQGLLGAVFRKAPHMKFPDSYKEQLEYMTADGLDIEGFANLFKRKILSEGRIGVLLDPGKDEERRAYAAIYDAGNIVNWEMERIGNKDVPVMIVLRENYKANVDDEFDRETKPQYRVLRLSKQTSGQRVYTQEVWRKTVGANGEEWAIDATLNVTPLRGGVPVDSIPFVICNAEDLTWNTCKPPILDLVDANLSHYITSADLEHGAHFTALPTPWVAGFPKDTKLSIGSGVAWVSESTDANCGMLEYTGQGLESLRGLKKDKEALMAILGARLLEESKPSVEAGDTMKIRRAGESGALAANAKVASAGIASVLKWMLFWSGAESQMKFVEFELNTDYVNASLTPQELAEYVKTWQQGGMSMDTYLYNLKKGEVLAHDRTIEDEKDLINAEGGGGFADSMGGAGAGNVIPMQRNFQIVRDSNGKAIGINEGGKTAGVEE